MYNIFKFVMYVYMYIYDFMLSTCLQYGASFVVDEVQTGGGSTGYMWYVCAKIIYRICQIISCT